MNATLTVNNVSAGIDGFGLLSAIVANLPDAPAFAPIYRELAKHQSTSVRAEVADKCNLDDETALLVLNDDSRQVIFNAIGGFGENKNAKKVITEAIISRLLDKNSLNITGRIVLNANSFPLVSPDYIYDRVKNNPDPDFRDLLASTSDVPRSVKRRLENDADLSVSMTAKGNNTIYNYWGGGNVPF